VLTCGFAKRDGESRRAPEVAMAGTRFSRRSFLKSSAVGTAGLLAPTLLRPSAAPAAEADILERLGVALYTVRDQMQADPVGTLKAIADLGYRYVESALLPSLGPALKAAGLKQASAYAPTYVITGNRKAWAGAGDLLPEGYSWSQVIDEAKKQGLQYLVIVYLMREERGGLDVYRALAAKLAKAGEACHKAGLGLTYHPHAFEYEAIEGVRPIELLLKETPKEALALELDTFWASIAGVDPVKMVQAHSGRVPLVHLKDKAAGTPVQYDEGKVPKEAFKEVGRGAIDFAAFLPAAAKAGVKYYYVEQDYSTGSPLDSLRTTRQALTALVAGKKT
jgi:sugar phosphate isomerase/epimerase